MLDRLRVFHLVVFVLSALLLAVGLHALVPPDARAVRVGDWGQGQPTVQEARACPGRVVFDQFTDQWYCD